MLTQNSFVRDDIWDENSSLLDSQVPNPVKVFAKAMREIGEIYLDMETKHGVSVDELERFLVDNDPGMIEKLNFLWKRIDSNIYDDFQNFSLTPHFIYFFFT